MYEWTSGYGAGNLIYTDADTFGWPLDYLNPLHPPKADWEFFRFGGNDYNVGVTGVFGQFSIEPTSRLILTAGGRYDRLDLENTLTFRTGMPVVAACPWNAASVYFLTDTEHETRHVPCCQTVQPERAFLPDRTAPVSLHRRSPAPRRPAREHPGACAEPLECISARIWSVPYPSASTPRTSAPS